MRERAEAERNAREAEDRRLRMLIQKGEALAVVIGEWLVAGRPGQRKREGQ